MVWMFVSIREIIQALWKRGGGTFLFLRKRNKLLNPTLFSSLIIALRFSLLVSES